MKYRIATLIFCSLSLLFYSSATASHLSDRDSLCTYDGGFEIQVVDNTTEGECRGKVIITANGTAGPFGLTIQSASGETQDYEMSDNWTIENLCEGYYSASFLTAYGCSFQQSFVITRCPEIEVRIDVLETVDPSSCNADDGEINYRLYKAFGGELPYTFQWYKNGVPIPYDPECWDICNVTIGTYCLVATDANGCKGENCFNVGDASLVPLIESVEIQNACAGTASGSIYVFLDSYEGQTENDTYTFSWSNGVTEQNWWYSHIYQLEAGDYAVTITNDSSPECTVVETFQIEEEDISVNPLEVSVETIMPCPGDNTGEIKLNIDGGTPPYLIDWWDDFGSPTTTKKFLAEGQYSYTVRDRCGQIFEDIVTLIEPSLVLWAEAGCAYSSGSVGAYIENGNPPFTYSWSTDSDLISSSQSMNNLFGGVYYVTVTDATGCEFYGDKSLINKTLSVEQVSPCPDFNDGSITIYVQNPDEENVELFIDGIFISDLGNNSTIVYVLDGLSASPNTILIEAQYGESGNCIVDYRTVLRAEGFTEELFHYDDDNDECIYDLYCKGDYLGEEARYTESVVWSTWDAHGGAFQDCGLKGYCGDTEVDFFEMGLKKITDFEYRLLLQRARECSALPEGWIDLVSSPWPNGPYLGCKVIRYCPANLAGINTAWWSSDGNPEPIIPISDDGDCVWLSGCGLPNDRNTFCYSELLADEIDYCNDDGDFSFINCDPIQLRAIHLVEWHADMINDPNINYYGTDLYNRMESIISSQELLDKAWCGNIAFCRSDFTILWDDVNNVECGIAYPINDMGGVRYSCQRESWYDYYVRIGREPMPGFENVYNVVCNGPVCESDGCFPLSMVTIELYPYAGIDGYVSPDGTVSEQFSVINPQTSGFRLSPFSFTIDNGVVHPNLVANDGQKNILTVGDSRSTHSFVRNIGETVAFIDDFDNDVIYSLDRKAHDWYSVSRISGAFSEELSIELESEGFIMLNELKFSSGRIIVSGIFQGSLILGGELLSMADDSSAISMAFTSNDLVYESHLVVKGVKEVTNVWVDSQSVFISGKSQDAFVEAGSSIYDIGQETSFIAHKDFETNFTSLEAKVRESGSIDLESISSNGESTVYVFDGNGEVRSDDELILSNTSLDSGFLSLVMDSQNEGLSLFSLEDISYESLGDISTVLSKISIAGEVFLGLSFTSKIVIRDSVFESRGGSDILLIKFDENGAIDGVMHYGSTGEEIVEQLFLIDERVLAFGGQLGESDEPFKLGHRFVLSEIESSYAPFIAGVEIKDFEWNQKHKGHVVENNTRRGSEAVFQQSSDFLVYPNPASDFITVSYVRGSSNMDEALKIIDAEVRIFSSIGNELITIEGLSFIQNQRKEIDIKGLSTGVYILQISEGEGKIHYFKIFKQ